MTEQDMHWLAGLLEGEGAFCAPPPSSPRRPRVVLVTTDLDVAERAHALMGGGFGVRDRRAKAHHKTQYVVTVNGRPALELMDLLYPLMGERRRRRIAEVKLATPTIGVWYGRDIKLSEEQHVEIAAKYAAGGLSQAALAVEYGVSQPMISYIVRKAKFGLTRAGGCDAARSGGGRKSA